MIVFLFAVLCVASPLVERDALPPGGRLLVQGEEAVFVRYAPTADTSALAGRWHALLVDSGWSCEPLRRLEGQGLVAGCERAESRPKLLTVSALPGQLLVAVATYHPHPGPHHEAAR